MIDLRVIDASSLSKGIKADRLPEKCPICHYSITPIFHFGFYDKNKWNENSCLQTVYRCPRADCGSLFISYHKSDDEECNKFSLRHSLPIKRIVREFSRIIENISPSFCLIYNQAFVAEQDNLMEMCGIGYRKSVEFLIKDYLISIYPKRANELKNKKLGSCISDDVRNDNIKNVAKRAVWLGNDETHYLRKWQDKDLKDLKRLIDLTIHWIEMEKLTEEFMEEMPG